MHQLLPSEIIAEIAMYDVAIWRGAYASCRAVWNAMKQYTDRAKEAFAVWETGNFSRMKWQRLPNRWRHGRMIEGVFYRHSYGYSTRHYRNNLQHGESETTIDDIVIRRYTACNGKMHGHWRGWDPSTGELEGHVELEHGVITHVHVWTYVEFDKSTRQFVPLEPSDSDFVLDDKI